MKKLIKATITGVITAAIAFAIVWFTTLIGSASFIDAIRQAEFWVVEGAAIAIAVIVVLSESSDDATPARSPMGRVAEHVAWAAVITMMIGTLLAIATDTPVRQVLTSSEFLIAAAITLTAVALEAWPKDRPEKR